ncbi:MAG TPA: DUF2339 domain-containing protein [Candidatus Angelobacter sp.]|jgi:hypothetical protein
MEYILLFFFGWMVVCLPALIVTLVANNRRRRETSELSDRIANLTKQLEALERRSSQAGHVPQAAPLASFPVSPLAHEEARPVAPPIPVQKPVEVEKPAPVSIPTPKPVTPPVIAPPIAAQTSTHSESKPVEAGHPATPPSATPLPNVPVRQPAAPIAASSALPHQPSISDARASASLRGSGGFAGFTTAGSTHDILSPKKRGMSLEETVGTNWLPKLGITVIVIGIGFLVANKWGSFPPFLRVLILYAGAIAALVGGIFLERKERYQTLGRALIGGGWAVTVLVTYGLRHAPFMAILPSNAIDLLLLMAVIGVMVWHTLRYNSQLVTGASFLLGFAAITLNPDPPYNLLAGALLVAGMTIIVLRYNWFELEIFGILASYLNHFYWLYSIFGLDAERHTFPHQTTSMLLVIAYWAVFRCSYVWRKVSSQEEESVSTIAGLLNPLMFLAVMKYQSFHPEWAFYALLGLGAAEFLLGQLPVSRKRIAPFQVLSSLGAAFMVAAVPFKFSGNSLEMLWLAAAEAFLLAGIFTRERLFRGFGVIISALVAGFVTVGRIPALLQEVTDGQPHHHVQLGIVLAVIAAVLYANTHIIGRRWTELFKNERETQALRTLSFVASAFAVCAVYSLVPDNAIALVLALLVFALSLMGRQLSINDLIYQAHWIAIPAVIQAVVTGQSLELAWLGIHGRVLIFVPVAGLLYLSSREVRLSETNYKTLFAGGYTWAASSLLTILIRYEAPEPWIPVGWICLALGLAAAARFWKDRALLWQTHVISLLAAGWTLYASFDPKYRGTSIQLFSVAITAGSLYLLNWITNITEIIGDERISQAYSWVGSLLLSWLIWYQVPAIDVSLVWGIFGLALFMIGDWKSWAFLRAQAYVALTFSFAHIFYANFNVLPTPGGARPEVLTVVPLVGIYFFIYWQIHGKKDSAALASGIRVEHLLACLGTATLAALVRFELPPEAVAIGYAALVIGALLAALFTRLQVFQYQALALLGMAAFRVSMNNFYQLHESFGSSLSSSLWTIFLLAAGVPICLRIRKSAGQTYTGQRWAALLASHAEQPMFFVPFVLMGVLLALKVAPGMITLAWGGEAVVVFVLALWARERSFRLAGLALLILCVAKIVFWDAWQLDDPTARYLTLIGVGSLILVVSYLISRNREALREYL